MTEVKADIEDESTLRVSLPPGLRVVRSASICPQCGQRGLETTTCGSGGSKSFTCYACPNRPSWTVTNEPDT